MEEMRRFGQSSSAAYWAWTEPKRWKAKRKKREVVRKNEHLLTELKYARANHFTKGLATVYTRDFSGIASFITSDENGEIQNPENLSNCGLMDTMGKWILPDKYQYIDHLRSDYQSQHLFLATRATHTGTGVITIQGEIVIPFHYTNLRYIGNGVLSDDEGTANQQVKIINLKNDVLIDTKASAMPASTANSGLLPVITTPSRKTGFVNQKGKWIIPPIFELIGDFEKVN